MYEPMTNQNKDVLLKKYHDFVLKYETVTMSVKGEEGEVQSNACNQAISDIRTVRNLICNVIDKPAATPEEKNSYLVGLHKFFRYIYVSLYFYIMPFLIICFRTILLYSGEIYTDNMKQAEVPSATDDSKPLT